MDGATSQYPNHERALLTPEMIDALRAQAARTGVGPHVLARDHLRGAAGVTEAALYRWTQGAARRVPRGGFDLVLRTWERLPDLSTEYVVSDPQIRNLMREHRHRTSVGIVKLLRERQNVPEGLVIRQMEHFYYGRVKLVRRDYFEYVMALWQTMPDCGRVTLTPEMLATLRDHIERTGKGPVAILRGAKDKPDGLTGAIVRAWLKGQATARNDHVKYILSRYASARSKSKRIVI